MGILSRLFGSQNRPAPSSSTKRPSVPRQPRLPRGVAPPSGTEALVLYKFDSCPYCQRVMQQIAPLGLTESIEMQDTRQDPKARTLLQESTGRTQVPCLFIDGKPLFESSDIADYLQAYSLAKAKA